MLAPPTTGDDAAEGPVRGVSDPRPGNARGLHAAGGLPVHGVLHQRGQEVVRGADGVSVAGEMDVDLVFRDDGGLAPAGPTALDAEDGAKGGLAQGDRGLVTQETHALSKPHRGRGLPFASRGRRDAGDDHQLSRALGRRSHGVQRDLGLVAPVGGQVLAVQPQGCGDVRYRLHCHDSNRGLPKWCIAGMKGGTIIPPRPLLLRPVTTKPLLLERGARRRRARRSHTSRGGGISAAPLAAIASVALQRL